MKKILSIITIFLLLFWLCFSTVDAKTKVRWYYKKNWTYVKSHYRSDRDWIKRNNWSHKGNTNPYTGKKWTKKTYKKKYHRKYR